MYPKIVFSNSSSIFEYAKKCFESNGEYTPEDIEWMLKNFQDKYLNFVQEVFKLYTMLSLTNLNTFCGYFSQNYNIKLMKFVKERDTVNFNKTLLQPVFEELTNNVFLDKNEKTELSNILSLECMVANLTIKRMSVKNSLAEDIDKLYLDSYNDIYSKMFMKKINYCKMDFQPFVLITEYNSKNRNSYAYTFKLFDILSQCITEKYVYELSESNIQSIKDRFNLEMKMVKYNLSVF